MSAVHHEPLGNLCPSSAAPRLGQPGGRSEAPSTQAFSSLHFLSFFLSLLLPPSVCVSRFAGRPFGPQPIARSCTHAACRKSESHQPRQRHDDHRAKPPLAWRCRSHGDVELPKRRRLGDHGRREDNYPLTYPYRPGSLDCSHTRPRGGGGLFVLSFSLSAQRVHCSLFPPSTRALICPCLALPILVLGHQFFHAHTPLCRPFHSFARIREES